jgi:hypothetical protein
MDKPQNPPAFPVNWDHDDKGMTLRDWFAGQALGVVPDHLRQLQTDHRIKIAEWAYGMADAMLAASKEGRK